MKKLIIIAIAISLIACKKENDSPANQQTPQQTLNEKLNGTYTWNVRDVYTFTFLNGSCTASDELGYVVPQNKVVSYTATGTINNFTLSISLFESAAAVFINCYFDSSGNIQAIYGDATKKPMTLLKVK
jgi:hypothetical protein